MYEVYYEYFSKALKIPHYIHLWRQKSKCLGLNFKIKSDKVILIWTFSNVVLLNKKIVQWVMDSHQALVNTMINWSALSLLFGILLNIHKLVTWSVFVHLSFIITGTFFKWKYDNHFLTEYRRKRKNVYKTITVYIKIFDSKRIRPLLDLHTGNVHDMTSFNLMYEVASLFIFSQDPNRDHCISRTIWYI